MIETNGLLLGLIETQLDYYTVEETTAGLGDDCNGGADFWAAGGKIHKFTLRTDYSGFPPALTRHRNRVLFWRGRWQNKWRTMGVDWHSVKGDSSICQPF